MLKIIAAILEAPVNEKILTYLGLDPQSPPKAPARGAVPHLAVRAASAVRQPPQQVTEIGSEQGAAAAETPQLSHFRTKQACLGPCRGDLKPLPRATR